MFNITFSTLLDILVRTVAVYLVVLLGLRLAGKREIGQMTVFDLVVLLLIANAVQNAMVGPDTSLVGGILAAIVLLVVNAILARMLMQFPRLRRWVEGTPTLLVLHGNIIEQNMSHEGIDKESLLAVLREHGIAKLDDVDMAVLEIDGSISVVPAGGGTTRTKKSLKFLRRQ